jgi:hypothetical protein
MMAAAAALAAAAPPTMLPAPLKISGTSAIAAGTQGDGMGDMPLLPPPPLPPARLTVAVPAGESVASVLGRPADSPGVAPCHAIPPG